jgi:hypothetical protein
VSRGPREAEEGAERLVAGRARRGACGRGAEALDRPNWIRGTEGTGGGREEGALGIPS